MIKPSFEILNQKGTPMFYSDVYANIPTAGIVGRMFISTDTYAFYRDTGSGWDLIGGPGTGTITGSGATGQVSFFNGATTIGGSNNLFWDSANNRLGIGTATPGVPLDIHTTGTGITINGTTTNNSFLTFQNAGTGKWRIGNNYSTGSNYFSIYDVLNTTERLSITNAGVGTYTGNFNISGTLQMGDNLLLNPNNTIGGAGNTSIRQIMATNDYWSIYGNSVGVDQGEMVLEVGDNGSTFSPQGQRFNFYFNNASSGTAKSVLILDYDTATFQTSISATTGTFTGNLSVGGSSNINGYTGKVITLGTSTTAENVLEIYGGVTGSDNVVGAIDFTNSYATGGGKRIARIVSNRNGDNNSGNLLFSTLNSGSLTTKMVIAPNGNIGVGTTSTFADTNYVSIYIGASTGGQLILGNSTGGSGNRYLQLQGDSTGGYVQSIKNAPLFFYTNAAEKMALYANGDLMIGQTSDTGWKTDINGKLRHSGQISITGSVSIAAGATSTIYTIPSATSNGGLYHVIVGVLAGGNIYTASGIVTATAWNAQADFTSLYDGANVTLSLSGMNIQIKNDGFGTFTWWYSISFQPINAA